ncbi:hypothetical protein AGLY_010914 [Aphis glycines]|uniref:HAT C-terminal dimerisation domain-containing protein n=1 Tax=Aphis glycines TaxID=307491 RepID=A0A6G0TCC8_APHGL|nr:hypothetical protein AGLY_010914 [Aphis glycines]
MIDVAFVALPTPRCRRVPKFSDELQKDEPITDPITKFKIECYYSALDIIQNELNDRFGNDEAELLKDLSLLSKKRILEVKNSPNSLPKDAFKIVCELYSTFLQYDDLVNEYQQFCSNFLELEKSILLPKYLHNKESESDESVYEDDFDNVYEIVEQDEIENQPVFVTRNLENVGSMGKLFKLFCVSQLKNVFPNLHTLLHIAVTLPVSSCSVERSFSKLKLVKSKLRTTMKKERFESLLKITCEQDCVPNVENKILKGCRFHLEQSWWRKIQNLGLANEYKSDSELKSKFPPKIWSEFYASSMRTTNSCESFRSHFNSMFYTAHPNIYQFLEILKNVQIYTYIKMRSLEVMKKRNCILLKEKCIAGNMNKNIQKLNN